MFFGKKIRFYTVHVKPDDKSSKVLEDTVLVQEGFRWLAFLFPFLWALFNKMWLLAFLLVAIFPMIDYLQKLGEITIHTAFIAKLTIQIFVALSADDLKRSKLKGKGYVFYDVVSGDSESSAQLRFFERYT